MIRENVLSVLDPGRFSFELSADSVIGLLGYDLETVPLPVSDSVEKIIAGIPTIFSPRGGYKIFASGNIEFGKDCFIIEGLIFNCGKIIASNLTGCDSIAILISTTGEKISDYPGQLIREGDSLGGFIADKIASEIAEQCADIIEKELNIYAKGLKSGVTNRYSPGYCGWDVGEQHKLFSLLPENFCGVKLTESALMVPVKSISAVIGIGEGAEKKDYQCSICDIDFCYKRERKK